MHILKSNELFSTIKIILLVTVVLQVFMKSRFNLWATQEAIIAIQSEPSENMEKLAFYIISDFLSLWLVFFHTKDRA